MFESNHSSHLGGTAVEVNNQSASLTSFPAAQLDSARNLGQPRASIRFRTLVEAAAGCRAEIPCNDPTEPTTEAIADTTLTNSTNSTTGISPVLEFALNSRDSPAQPFPRPHQLSNPNDAFSPTSFRNLESPQTLSTGLVTTEAALSSSTTPTLSPHEARLMQHFIEHLAPSIDVVCSSQIFGRLVPRMAFQSPVLLTSIFAVASKHISKTKGVTYPTPETYFQETLDHLIPVLNEPHALVEDYILAAVVILRVMEEMDSKSRTML